MSFRGILSWVNRSASASVRPPLTAPVIVAGRPCNALGFGCIIGLDGRADGGLCGEEEYGGGGGRKSSSVMSRPDVGVGGMDNGRGLGLATGRSRSLESRDKFSAGS